MEKQTEMISIDNNRNFIDLVEHCYEKYNDLIQVKLPNNAYDRIKYFDSILKHNDQVREDRVKELLSPYFIGYGNPNSELLILGKEKGFNILNTDQVILESIENTFYWHEIVNHRHVQVDLHNFGSPLKPYGGIKPNLSRGHTWRLYQDFLNFFYNAHDVNSFLNKSFITEFNYRPSKLSPGKVIIDEKRMHVLGHAYFKTFPKVLLTYRSYDKYNIGLTERLFDVQFIKSGEVGKQSYLLYFSKDKQRKVLLTNQLSWLAGWSDLELQQLAEILR